MNRLEYTQKRVRTDAEKRVQKTDEFLVKLYAFIQDNLEGPIDIKKIEGEFGIWLKGFALDKYEGSRTHAAKWLGTKRTTLIESIRANGLIVPFNRKYKCKEEDRVYTIEDLAQHTLSELKKSW